MKKLTQHVLAAACATLGFTAPLDAQEPPPAEPPATAPAPTPPTVVVPQVPAEPPPAADATVDPAVAAELDALVEDAGGIEVIVVTGSRIGRKSTDSYGNVAVVTDKDVAAAGVATLDDLLTQLPTVSLQGINRNANNGGNGLAFVELRNLGTSRTLVLINGRRMVSSGSGVGEGVDFNNVPVELVERVEVLLDGASAIYGSDAIGGVINVILKSDFDGFEVRTLDGISTHGDGEEIGVSGTMGHNFERGNVTFNVGYIYRGEIRQRDRDWARHVISDAERDPETGEIIRTYGSAFTPEGWDLNTGYMFRPVLDANGNVVRSYQEFTNFYEPDGGAENTRYNYGKDQWLSGMNQRINLAAMGSYELSDHVKAYMEGLFTHRRSQQQMSAEPLHGGNATYPDVGIPVPLSNPYVPEDYRLQLPAGTTEVLMFRRFTDVGNRSYRNTADTFRVIGGLSGDLMNQDLKWDVSMNFGRNRQIDETRNSINYTRFLETLDPEVCARNAARGCVVSNPFGPRMSDEVLDYIRYNDVQLVGYDLFMIEGSVTGKLVEIPTGDRIGFALGADYREEYGFTFPDVLVQSGDAANNSQEPTEGRYNVKAAFAELSFPLLVGQAAAEELTLDLAARFSDFNTFGSDFTYRAGVAYAPVPDLKVRANFSTAFRAPGISDLYGGSVDSYEDVEDPCSSYTTNPDIDANVRANCVAAGVPADYDQANFGTQVRTNIGGNPNLEAETAKVLNLGLVIQPRAVEGLAVTADFYRIDVDNGISAVNPQTVIDRCYRSPNGSLSDPFCAKLSRDAGTGALNGLTATSQNVAGFETHGVDMAVAYEAPLTRLGMDAPGTVSLSWSGNVLLNLDEDIYGVIESYEGTIDATTGSYTKLRWNATAGYGTDDWSVSTLVRFIGGAERYGIRGPDGEIPDNVAYPDVDATWYWDLYGSYTWEGLSVILGVDNVLDKDPPYALDSTANANAQTYDFVGRYVYTNVAYKF